MTVGATDTIVTAANSSSILENSSNSSAAGAGTELGGGVIGAACGASAVRIAGRGAAA